ncbi:CrcB family protein [Lentzea alba]|uniref:CrcB family protein n=1 Tax=Lentzea alba TaxID=2714351 RepID=UPI0039BFA042
MNTSPNRPDPRFVLLVSLGGGLGGVARYGLSVAVVGPMGIFVINVLGSFLIGVLMGTVPRPLVRAFFGVGFLGGFTTFSSYAVAGSPVFLVLTPLCAVLAAFLGLRVTR